MSTISHHRVVPRAMGPLNLLENIAEVPDQQVTKTGESSIFCLSSSVSVTVSQASTIMAEAIATIQSRKSIINHQVLHSPPIACKELGMVGKFQNSNVLVSMYGCLYTPFF